MVVPVVNISSSAQVQEIPDPRRLAEHSPMVGRRQNEFFFSVEQKRVDVFECRAKQAGDLSKYL